MSKKLLNMFVVVLTYFGLSYSTLIPLNIVPKVQAAPVEHDVTLTTTVTEYITLDISGPAADTVAFGNLTPGTPICYNTGTVATVSTNAANGYTLGLDDNTAAPDSSMLHTDTATHIPKMTNGTIATPVVWGTNYGVAIGLYAADTTKEAKWGTGTTVCDANNKYSAVPETATTAHTAAGGTKSADTSSWSFKIDVQNTQKTGAYSGTVTYTATAVLS